jgi:hypothetical protein
MVADDGDTGGWVGWGTFAVSLAVLALGVPLQSTAEALSARLGPHSLGRSCRYAKRLAAVDLDVLESLVSAVVKSSPKGP